MAGRYPAQVRERFFAAVERGASIPRAAAEVGVDRSTGGNWARYARLGITPGRNGRRLTEEHREQFWQQIEAGLSIRAATGQVGVSEITGRRWFDQAGGMAHVKQRAGVSVEAGITGGSGRLSFLDRCHIEVLTGAGYTPAQIARLLGRHRATIGRELARGRGPGSSRYRATTGQRVLDEQARRPKKRKLTPGTALYEHVRNRLGKRHSPEQISGALPQEFPDDPEMRVSHEAIYQALYVQARGGLRAEVAQALRTGRYRRKHHGRTPTAARPRFEGLSISERPAEADDRAVPGHWEGDLIIGANTQSAIGTLVERTTGFVMLLHLPGDHTAATVAQAMTDTIGTLPEVLWQSLTWDQGSEMANHSHITELTGLPIYFADPHSPWQRGSNENTNGLLRQYFPKGTDLSVHGPGTLTEVAAELNDRPRKRHHWRTPTQLLKDLLDSPPTHDAVALTP